jgi:hypothetical protein
MGETPLAGFPESQVWPKVVEEGSLVVRLNPDWFGVPTVCALRVS